MELSPRDAQVLECIKAAVAEGRRVSRREISRTVGIKWERSVSNIVIRLEAAGLIRRVPGSFYRFEVIDDEEAQSVWGKSMDMWPTRLLRAVRDAADAELVRRSSETMRGIIEAVCRKYGLAYEEIVGPSREHRIAHPRQEAAWEMVQRGRWSGLQIAKSLGLKDHTTVLHAIKAHEARMAQRETMKVAA